jgi:hypothetical protein
MVNLHPAGPLGTTRQKSADHEAVPYDICTDGKLVSNRCRLSKTSESSPVRSQSMYGTATSMIRSLAIRHDTATLVVDGERRFGGRFQ